MREGREARAAVRRLAATLSVAAAAALTALGPVSADAQLRPSYGEGQHVSPAFEGWVEKPDGSKAILFGYMNRNWEEVIHVPIGEDNRFLNGPEDLGQPTEFLPRRNRFVFEVPVPDGFTEEDELVWELTTHGVTQRAYASIKPDFKLDNVAMMSETGALGAGTSDAETRANQPPEISLEGPTERTVRVGETLRLVATVTDDGIPERSRSAQGPPPNATPQQLLARALNPPVRITVGKINALYMTWFPYRGAGALTFEPPQVKPWEDTRPFQNSPWALGWVAPELPEDGRWVTEVTFHEPGTYVLRGRADDGGLYDDVEVTVHVQPLAN
ncbi:MAG TPA: hypothetical protein VFQ22_08125 [Longimicrobiales bacterium]|nr:hypothetical protein [Longimicrobiales bacterium]